MKNILMIIGSLREESFNRQLAGEIEKIIGDRAQVTYMEYSDLPYMNQDIEFPAPKPVARVREEVKKADGIWIVTPEYNHAVPGVLKNLLDWLSRALIKNDWETGSAVRGKLVTISGAAGKSAAVYVREQLKGLLEQIQMKVIGGEGTGVSLNADMFASGKLVLSDEVKKNLKEQAEAFLREL